MVQASASCSEGLLADAIIEAGLCVTQITQQDRKPEAVEARLTLFYNIGTSSPLCEPVHPRKETRISGFLRTEPSPQDSVSPMRLISS